MNTILLSSPNKADLKIFTDLAKRIGIMVKVLSDEEILDLGLLKAMEEGEKSKFVSKEKVMAKLMDNGNKV